MVSGAWGALAAAPARSAAVSHAPGGVFNGDDVPQGPFRYLLGIGIDDSSGPSAGDVYAANQLGFSESEDNEVFKFDEEGSYAGVTFNGTETPAGSMTFLREGNGFYSFDTIEVIPAGAHEGEVYVADLKHNVVNRFSETGHYLCQITGAATPSASECAGLLGSQTPAGGFLPGGLAIDRASGVLYVSDSAHGVIDKFDESGAFIGQIADPHLTEPIAIELDSTGAIYVLNGSALNGEFPPAVYKFDSSGAFISTIDSNAWAVGITVDPTTDRVYVGHLSRFTESEPGEIVEYDAAGNPLHAIKSNYEEGFFYGLSLAVNPASGRLYAGLMGFGSESRITTYSPDTVAPGVSLFAPTIAGKAEVALSGEVDPTGVEDVTSCRFEYGPPAGPGEYERYPMYHQSIPCSPAPPYHNPTVVSANIGGLSPSSTYRYRLVAATDAGVSPYTKRSPILREGTFGTLGPPTVRAESVSSIERYSAMLHAKVNPQGYNTEYKFEFVDAKHFEEEGGYASPATRSTSPSQIGNGGELLAENQTIAGLTVGTTYHYRVVATNERGTAAGEDKTFTTIPIATIEGQWAYAGLKSSTAEAEINPTDLDTTCEVEYVDDDEFQATGYANATTTPCDAGLGSGSNLVRAKAPLAGLSLNTKYHFRFVARNASGSLVGADTTFSTFGIESFSIELLDKEGHPYTQAGGHPYEKIISYRFTRNYVAGAAALNGLIKDLITEQPPGQSGARVEETPKCPGYLAEDKNCPASTWVGVASIEGLNGGEVNAEDKNLYEIVPPQGVASRYATIDPYASSDSRVRSGSDYGISSVDSNLAEEGRLLGITARIWGVPSDHNGSGAPRVSILRNPTACAGPQTARIRADTWEASGEYVEASDEMPAITGCDKLEFHPSIEWRPTSKVADSPTGLHVDIHQAQNKGPDELSYADLKDVVIEPAKGLIFNPAGVTGLIGCTMEQFGYQQDIPAECPEASKIGNLEIDTPLVDHPMLGGIYMAKAHDNPFGSMFAIYLAIDDKKKGVVIKLSGEIQADHQNGQLTASFAENPQLPVEDFKLDFFGGPQAVLRTPNQCGTYETESTLTPWSAPASGGPAHSTDSYQIDEGPNGLPCVADEAEAPNKPAFRAGTIKPVAGAYSPFVMTLKREDGTQQIADLTVKPPPGLLGRLAGIPRCSEASIARAEQQTGEQEAAHPSCPAGSQVGTVIVGAGAGSRPFFAEGKVYVADSYRGAPVSLAVVVPVVAGPFDLGTVVVRTPLQVDLETGQVRVHSDPIPTILEGVSLDIRTIAVKLDRPDFTVNPTSCDPTATTGSVTSLAGQSLSLSDVFQLGECNKLGFAPKVGLHLKGKLHRRSHPGLRAVLRMPKGGANISRVAVSMPPTEFLDNEHIQGICTKVQFNAGACPADSIYGYSKAWTPLLDQPLAGPVYLRSSEQGLPDLVAELNGEFRLALAGHIGSERGGIRANVKGLPDVPVSKFVMNVFGGDRGLLRNSIDACAGAQQGTIELEGHNGKVEILHPVLQVKCGRQPDRRR